MIDQLVVLFGFHHKLHLVRQVSTIRLDSEVDETYTIGHVGVLSSFSNIAHSVQ